MAVSPTGDISLRISRVRAMVANSTTFRTWVGAADAAAALAYIHVGEYIGEGPGPLCVVGMVPGGKYINVAQGMSQTWEEGIQIFVEFADDIAVDDQTDAYYTFANAVGAIRAEVMALSGSSTSYAVIGSMTMVVPPTRGETLDGKGDAMECIFVVESA